MPQTPQQPVAARARAHIGPSRWLRRPVRLVQYDARWADGRVEFDVNPSELTRGQHTTDRSAIDDSIHADCPEAGIGPWVRISAGAMEEIPEPVLSPPEPSGGRPRKYKRTQPSAKRIFARRLGWAAAGLGVGIALVSGPLGDGFGGMIGMLCCLFGIVLLAGLNPRRRQRPW